MSSAAVLPGAISIVSVITGIIGIICVINSSRNKYHGGIKIGGLVCSILGMVVSLLYLCVCLLENRW